MFGIDDAALGAILGGAGQLAGGASSLFGSKGGFDWNAFSAQANFQQNQFNAQMADNWAQFNAGIQDSWAKQLNQEDFQRELAQNGIRYRVEDAMRSGISPLVALGAPTFNPSVSVTPMSPIPVQAGGAPAGAYTHGSDIGGAIKSMGAGLKDILGGSLTDDQKRDAKIKQIQQDQQIKSNDMDIAIKGAQLGILNQRMMAPGAANVNGTDPVFGKYKPEDPKVPNALPNTMSTTAGPPTPGTTFEATPTGLKPTPSMATPAGNNPEIFSPEYGRWAAANLVTPDSSRAPPLDYVRKFFPGATGVRWDQTSLEWRAIVPEKSPSFSWKGSSPPTPYFKSFYDRWFGR